MQIVKLKNKKKTTLFYKYDSWHLINSRYITLLTINKTSLELKNCI